MRSEPLFAISILAQLYCFKKRSILESSLVCLEMFDEGWQRAQKEKKRMNEAAEELMGAEKKRRRESSSEARKREKQKKEVQCRG